MITYHKRNTTKQRKTLNNKTNMKNLLIALVAMLALVSTSFAQSTTTTKFKGSGQLVYAQSQTVELTTTSLNLLYLRDGYDNFAAFAVPLYTVANTNGRLKLNTIGAFDPANIERRAYVGTGLSYDVVNEKGFRFTAFGGVKGFNVSDNFRFQDGQRGFVYGFGITIPFVTK